MGDMRFYPPPVDAMHLVEGHHEVAHRSPPVAPTFSSSNE